LAADRLLTMFLEQVTITTYKMDLATQLHSICIPLDHFRYSVVFRVLIRVLLPVSLLVNGPEWCQCCWLLIRSKIVFPLLGLHFYRTLHTFDSWDVAHNFVFVWQSARGRDWQLLRLKLQTARQELSHLLGIVRSYPIRHGPPHISSSIFTR